MPGSNEDEIRRSVGAKIGSIFARGVWAPVTVVPLRSASYCAFAQNDVVLEREKQDLEQLGADARVFCFESIPSVRTRVIESQFLSVGEGSEL